MAIIRKILGSIILFFNWLFTPKGVTREQEEQQKIDVTTQKLKLYQYNACPFCVKVRRAMKRMSLPIEIRDIRANPEYKKELEQEGGRLMVPCLRIENKDGSYTWMYESSDIINYLSEKFNITA
jgi:glutaredoxin